MKTAYSGSDSKKSGGIQLLRVFSIVIILAVIWTVRDGFAQKPYPDPPRTLTEDSVPKTVKAAADNGWIPCPGECLKLATPGWHHQEVAGHPPTDIWMTFRFQDPQGSAWIAYSQNHIGHIIRTYPDKPAQDVGNCPICNGTGWVRKDSANEKK